MSDTEQRGARRPVSRRDRRVDRTRDALHEALGSLLRERPYESIGIKQILDRANVARSTFYAHYTGKDELLLSGVHDILSSCAGAPLLDFAARLRPHRPASRRCALARRP